MASTSIPDYGYPTAAAPHKNDYLWPAVRLAIPENAQSVIDLGCGNRATAAQLHGLGLGVGVDSSESGVRATQQAHPAVKFEVADAYEPLASRFGAFDVVVSAEVIEHCTDPRALCRTAYSLLNPGGSFIETTPYHGFAKNFVLQPKGR